MASLFRLLYSKYHPPALTEKTFAGKTVLITGGTSGLGLEAAKKFATLDAWTVIITARDPVKGELAREEIEFVCQERASDDLDIQVWPLDMSDFASVRNFADRVNRELPRLDVAILNAGQCNRYWSKTSESNGSWEMTLMVNTLATIFLGLLLLPKLLSTADSRGYDPKDPPHLTFVSSGYAAFQKPEKYEKFQGSRAVFKTASQRDTYPGGSAQYGMSKLFLEYGMRRIARLPSVAEEEGEMKIIVNSTCPGMCESNLRIAMATGPFLKSLVWLFDRLFSRSADQGSRIYVSAVQRGVESQGKMWKDDQYKDLGPMVNGEQGRALADEIWKEMVEIFESQSSGIRDMISSP